MKSYRIAFIPGDGVRQEVALEAKKVLDTISAKHELEHGIEHLDWGCDYYLEHQRMMPEDGLEKRMAFNAIAIQPTIISRLTISKGHWV